MGFNCGIVGLPNVGKSTLFNALTASAAAEAANYSFTTIEPNVGRVAVPDPRLATLQRLTVAPKTVPTYLEFVDIAGLVKGASRGEGLGNKFLGQIREVDAVAHVLRCFEGEVTHVEGSVDPVRDAGTVATELMLADLEMLERRVETIRRKATGGDKDAKAELALLEPALAALEAGRPARSVEIADNQRDQFRQLQLLTAKPVLYIANVEEQAAATGNDHTARVAELAASEGAECVVVSAAIEAEIAQLTDPAEKAEFLESLGLAEAGLERVIAAGYRLLDLITFFTANETEARAWTVPRGTTAPAGAGRVHSDFERGFICAETASFADFEAAGGETGAREAGKLRQEGRDYVIQDGDVILFRFNV